MNYNIALSSKAEKHIDTAYDWYELQRKGLGDDFLVAVDKALLSIQSNPLFYGFRKKNIRGFVTKGFPYLILYYLKGNNIRVLSVFHMSRKPEA